MRFREERQGTWRAAMITGLACAGALIALLGFAATAQALNAFGSTLRDSGGPVVQANANRNCQQDANALDSSEQCDRVATQYRATGSPGGKVKAPKDGVIKRIRLVANHKGHFRFELAKAKFRVGANPKAKLVHRGERIEYHASTHIQTFHVHERVHKDEYLAIRSRKTAMLNCQQEPAEQLLFQPVLRLDGPYTSNLGHESHCTLLLKAVYGKG